MERQIATCQIFKHKNKEISHLCLQQKCQNRLICVQCLSEDHRKHKTTILNPENNGSALCNLSMHSQYEYKQSAITKLTNIHQIIINNKQKFNKKIKTFQESMQKYLQYPFITILNSFYQNSSELAINELFLGDQNTRAKNAQRIASSINNMELPHIKDQVEILLKLSEYIINNFMIVFQKEANKIQNILTGLKQILKQNCIFLKNKDWKNFLQKIENKQKIKERQLQIKQDLLKQANNKNWIQIINKKNELFNIQRLQLIQKHVDIIPDLSILYSLKKLDLSNEIHIYPSFMSLSKNTISRIQNLKNLQNLTYLNLWGNRINKIQGLETLINLTHLYLGSNKIQKIQNLQRLTKLKQLSLRNNKISKLQNLQSLTKLQKLLIQGNNINKNQLNQKQKKLLKRLQDQKTSISWILDQWE